MRIVSLLAALLLTLPSLSAQQTRQTKSQDLLPAPAAAASPALAAMLATGPDGFNYTAVDETEVGGPIYSFQDISATGTLLIAKVDDAGAAFSLGFLFPYYGVVTDQLAASTNGYLSADPADNGGDWDNDATLPTTVDRGSPDGARIYGYHDDLNAAVYAQAFPSCPRAADSGGDHACAIVQWEGERLNTTQIVSFQTVIYATGEIVHQYRTVDNQGASATIGGQRRSFGGATPSDGVLYTANTAGSIVPGRAIRYASSTAARLTVDTTVDEPFVSGAGGSASDCLDNSGGTPGNCSLREAISVANANPAIDEVTFFLQPGAGGLDGNGIGTFAPTTELPQVADADISINGISQQGASCTTGSAPDVRVVLDGSVNGVPNGLFVPGDRVSIRGLAFVGFNGGVAFAGADGSLGCSLSGLHPDGSAQGNSVGVSVFGSGAQIGTVAERNIVSGNSSRGISLESGAANAVLHNNWIGVGIDGSAARGNGFSGVSIINGNSGSVVGGAGTGEGNVIASNTVGVEIQATTGTRVIGNLIGTAADGLTSRGNTSAGVLVKGATGAAIGEPGAGNVIVANGRGILVDADNGASLTDGTTIRANSIGLVAAATGFSASRGNNTQGVYIVQGATNTVVGGPDVADRNVIAANGIASVEIITGGTDGTVIQNNYMGVGPDGVFSYQNSGVGVRVSNPSLTATTGPANTTIRDNVITNGGSSDGVEIRGVGTTGVDVHDNTIGVAADLSAVRFNRIGVYIHDGASDVDVYDNTIAGNAGSGVRIGDTPINSTGTDDPVNDISVYSNTIGILAPDGTTEFGNGRSGVQVGTGSTTDNYVYQNEIAYNGDSGSFASTGGDDGITVVGDARAGLYENNIHDNAGLGIDLGDDGVTPNDAGDTDSGPNDLLNYPVITSATSNGDGTVTVEFSVETEASTQYYVEFYRSETQDPSGFGEGAEYLDDSFVTTDAAGLTTGSATVTAAVGDVLTATLYDNSSLLTSEFSAAVVAAPFVGAFAVTNPIQDDEYAWGDPLNVRWTTLDPAITATDRIQISLVCTGQAPVVVVANRPNNGARGFLVPTSVGTHGGPADPGGQCIAEVALVNDTSKRGLSAPFVTQDPAKDVEITEPTRLSKYGIGDAFTWRWETSDVEAAAPGSNVDLSILCPGRADLVAFTNRPNNGARGFVLPTDFGAFTGCHAQVASTTDGTVFGRSAGFEIRDQPLPSVTITLPTSATTWQAGTTRGITWTTNSTDANVQFRILLDRPGISAPVRIAQTDNDGVFEWAIPANQPTGGGYRIRMTGLAQDGSRIRDVSELFTISAPINDAARVAPPLAHGWTRIEGGAPDVAAWLAPLADDGRQVVARDDRGRMLVVTAAGAVGDLRSADGAIDVWTDGDAILGAPADGPEAVEVAMHFALSGVPAELGLDAPAALWTVTAPGLADGDEIAAIATDGTVVGRGLVTGGTATLVLVGSETDLDDEPARLADADRQSLGLRAWRRATGQEIDLAVETAPEDLAFVSGAEWQVQTVAVVALAVVADAPDSLTLEPVSPNPTRGTARIRVGVPTAGVVTATVYDVRGRVVATLADGEQAAGWLDLDLDAGSLAAGVYVLRVQTGVEQATRTLTVVR